VRQLLKFCRNNDRTRVDSAFFKERGDPGGLSEVLLGEKRLKSSEFLGFLSIYR
jgi:hypothetical protein